jgi:ribosome biogenesis protein Tsr3
MIFLLMFAGMAFAGDPCEYAKSAYSICTTEFRGNTYYIVTLDKCSDVGKSFLYSNQFYSLERAHLYRDLRNASMYSVCKADEETEGYLLALRKSVWNEIK